MPETLPDYANYLGRPEITFINLSGPEEDPREIAAKRLKTLHEKYPACQLCLIMRVILDAALRLAGAHPARQNPRIIPH